jgi:hypothetical protein
LAADREKADTHSEVSVEHIGLSREEIARVEKIIAHLDTQPPGPGSERRLSPRIDFNHPMWLNLPADAGQPWVHVFSRNLSTSGLSFLSRKLFYVGQHLVISHELKERQNLLVLCRVCYCRAIEMGVQEVGLAFVSVEQDPFKQRCVPANWLGLVLQNDWLARKKLPALAAAFGS